MADVLEELAPLREPQPAFATWIGLPFLNETGEDALWQSVCPRALDEGWTLSHVTAAEAAGHAYNPTKCWGWNLTITEGKPGKKLYALYAEIAKRWF